MNEPLCWFKGKSLVAYLRGGNYTHPGNELLIEKALAPFPKDPQRTVLDVGCGLGGTAHYIQTNDWGQVIGIDIDHEAIHYAQTIYPHVKFYIGDAVLLSQSLNKQSFDWICLFSSFLLFSDQFAALNQLRKFAKQTSTLIVFDYTDLSNGQNPLTQAHDDDIEYLPILKESFKDMLYRSGWTVTNEINLDKECTQWYADLIAGFQNKKEELVANFGESFYTKGFSQYSRIYETFKNKQCGASIFYIKTHRG